MASVISKEIIDVLGQEVVDRLIKGIDESKLAYSLDLFLAPNHRLVEGKERENAVAKVTEFSLLAEKFVELGVLGDEHISLFNQGIRHSTNEHLSTLAESGKSFKSIGIEGDDLRTLLVELASANKYSPDQIKLAGTFVFADKDKFIKLQKEAVKVPSGEFRAGGSNDSTKAIDIIISLSSSRNRSLVEYVGTNALAVMFSSASSVRKSPEVAAAGLGEERNLA